MNNFSNIMSKQREFLQLVEKNLIEVEARVNMLSNELHYKINYVVNRFGYKVQARVQEFFATIQKSLKSGIVRFKDALARIIFMIKAFQEKHKK